MLSVAIFMMLQNIVLITLQLSFVLQEQEFLATENKLVFPFFKNK